MCTILATLLLLPVLIDATVLHIDTMTGLSIDYHRLSNDDGANRTLFNSNYKHVTTLTKCTFDGDANLFMLYTFLCGYVIPALLITAFYTQVLMRLHRSSVRRYRSQINRQQPRVQQVVYRNIYYILLYFFPVTKRIIAVILFYFFCWTPQWTLNLMMHFRLFQVTHDTLLLSAIFFGAHLLVCFNSAANPLLYALINRELRQQHQLALSKRRQSLSVATRNAIDFISRHSHSHHFHFLNGDSYAAVPPSRRQFCSMNNSDEKSSLIAGMRTSIELLPMSSTVAPTITVLHKSSSDDDSISYEDNQQQTVQLHQINGHTAVVINT